jgi:RimJ/RimL family protein N-acetyltransferase
MLTGKTTRLRKLQDADATRMLPHWNSYELRQYLASPLPVSEADLVELIASKHASFKARTEFFFGIEALDSSKLIGVASLENVSWLSRHAFVGMLGLFDPEQRGKGYGKDALLLLLDFGFNMLDLHAIILWVEAFNTSAINFYEGMGFKAGGTMREMAFRNGKRTDVIVMDMLKPEFLARYGVLPKTGAK